LEILEYCDRSQTTNREQCYLDLLKPEYNILKKADSRLGFKHSDETKAKIKARSLTPEQKAKHREYLNSQKSQEHLKRLHYNPKLKAKRLEQLKIYRTSKKHREHLNRLHSSLEYKAKILEVLNIRNASR